MLALVDSKWFPFQHNYNKNTSSTTKRKYHFFLVLCFVYLQSV